MRAIFESGFYYVYLLFIMGMGVYLIVRRKNALFGLACFILGFGDAFHLIPRAIGLYTNTLDSPGPDLAFWLGFGKLVTSLTMTAFYVLLYLFVFQKMNWARNRLLDFCVAVLVIVRIVLCCLPQNQWFENGNDVWWGFARNIPFILLGIVAIVLLFLYFRKQKYLGWMWLAVILSFGFYLPVVLFAAQYSWVGLLMLPKTVCYIWIGVMGLLNGIKTSKPAKEEQSVHS